MHFVTSSDLTFLGGPGKWPYRTIATNVLTAQSRTRFELQRGLTPATGAF